MKDDTPLNLIILFFTLKIVFIIIGVFLYFFNIPHLSILNVLFGDVSLYNVSILIPVSLIFIYYYCIRGLARRENLARIVTIVLCFFDLFIVPVGTVLAILIIGYLVFFEKTTFVDFKKPNLPFRMVGGFIIGVGIVGLLMIAGVISGVIDDPYMYGGDLSTMGFDDDGEVEVIIQMSEVGAQTVSVQNMMIQNIVDIGGTVEGRTVNVVNAIIVKVDSNQLSKIASYSNVVKIIPNDKIVSITDFDKTFMLDNTMDLINSEGFILDGVDGSGVVVAVVDTGINGDISALQRNGQSVVIDSYELYGDYTQDHGTLCASCIASQNSDYPGISPGVDLLDIGVFQSDGGATTGDIIQGWDWVINWKQSHDRFVICSNSFGAPAYSDMGILSQACDNMVSKYGIPMIVAAGNYRTSEEIPVAPPNSIETPGIARNAFTVGATDDYLRVTDFSCRGPGDIVDHKPDIVAPGHPVNMFDSNGVLVSYSGTSFSTPIVAGAMALLAQEHQGYSPVQFYNAFRRSAHDLGSSGFDYDYGYGFIDVGKANEMIDAELPESSYLYIFSGLSFMGFGIVSYPEWRKRL